MKKQFTLQREKEEDYIFHKCPNCGEYYYRWEGCECQRGPNPWVFLALPVLVLGLIILGLACWLGWW